jgi:iron complex outermembrane receptor protein
MHVFRPRFLLRSFLETLMRTSISSSTVFAFGTAVLSLASLDVPIALAADTGDSAALQEIVVTAQRREETSNHVPISVTALSGERLEALNAQSFQDYANTVPGLSYTYIGPLGYYGTRTYALRGISGTNTVGFYIDDSPLPLLDPKLIDIERIEVLRGPQATLYGSNSVGGTIKIITEQPDSHTFSGRVEGDASSTDGSDRANSRLAGVVNLPLIDGILGARISASRTENAGFINNYYDGYPGLVNNSIPPFGRVYHGVDYGSNNELAETTRIALRFTPNEQLTITPSLLYNSDQIDSNDFFFSNLPRFTAQHFIPTPESERFTLMNLGATYAADNVSITNTATYFRRRYTGVQDVTQFFPLAGYQTPTPVGFTTSLGDDIVTDELRALSTFDGPVNGLVGVQYSQNHQRNDDTGPIPGFNAFNSTLPPLSNESFIDAPFGTNSVEKDVYAEIRYKPIAQLEFTAGARYYWFDIHNYITASTGLLGGGPSDARTSEDGLRPRATVSYQLNDDLLLFANYAKGFRPGGTNEALPSSCSGNAGQFQGGGFKSDDVSSYDGGVKATLFEHRMQLNVSGYLMKWAGIQQSILLPCGFIVTANTGQATAKGMEVEGQVRPITPLTIDFQAAYAHTNLDTAQPGNFAAAGDPILNIPRWTFGLGAQYDQQVTVRWTGYTRVDYDYQGSAFLNYGDRPTVQPFVRDAYGTLGLHLGVHDDRWRVELYGSNVTNAHPVTNVYTFGTPPGAIEYSTIRPRTVGVDAAYSF